MTDGVMKPWCFSSFLDQETYAYQHIRLQEPSSVSYLPYLTFYLCIIVTSKPILWLIPQVCLETTPAQVWSHLPRHRSPCGILEEQGASVCKRMRQNSECILTHECSFLLVLSSCSDKMPPCSLKASLKTELDERSSTCQGELYTVSFNPFLE